MIVFGLVVGLIGAVALALLSIAIILLTLYVCNDAVACASTKRLKYELEKRLNEPQYERDSSGSDDLKQ